MNTNKELAMALRTVSVLIKQAAPAIEEAKMVKCALICLAATGLNQLKQNLEGHQ